MMPETESVYWDELYESPGARGPDLAEPLDALAAALAEEGVRRPLVVRPLGRRTGAAPGPFARAYEIINGRKRWRAALALVLAGRWAPDVTLPCQIVQQTGGKSNV